VKDPDRILTILRCSPVPLPMDALDGAIGWRPGRALAAVLVLVARGEAHVVGDGYWTVRRACDRLVVPVGQVEMFEEVRS
jgi:hypothetical protein